MDGNRLFYQEIPSPLLLSFKTVVVIFSLKLYFYKIFIFSPFLYSSFMLSKSSLILFCQYIFFGGMPRSPPPRSASACSVWHYTSYSLVRSWEWRLVEDKLFAKWFLFREASFLSGNETLLLKEKKASLTMLYVAAVE